MVEEGLPPFVASADKGLTVALDTTLTEELLQEGWCREIVNKVQNLRKKSGLEVSDRIELDIQGPSEVMAAVALHTDRITGDTLALGVAAAGDLPYKESFEIDGQEIGIALAKVDA